MGKISSDDSNKKHAETLIPVFVTEQNRYERDDVVEMLSPGCGNHAEDEKRAIDCIKKLKEYNILKAVKPQSDSSKDLSELNYDEFIICDPEDASAKCQYVFAFVGVVVICGHVLICCPKYLSEGSVSADELSEIVRVIEKYSGSHEDINLYTSNTGTDSFNLLAVLLYLMNDYYEFDVYGNTKQILENNGMGEIHWGRTIDDAFALMHNGRPYYPDLKTKRNINDEYDYFKRLHECILTIASRELKSCGLLDIFGIPEVDLSEEELDDFGETDVILYNIDSEINRQFNSRKRDLLMAMYSYVSKGESLNDTDGFSLYGTNSFNLVWEDVCSKIFDNKKNSRIGDLNLPTHKEGKFTCDDRLMNCIDKPYWSKADGKASETFEPDIICVKDGSFVILDAKYYNPTLEKGKKVSGAPGIESVTKQYLYRLAFKKFTVEYELSVRNCFLLPADKDVAEDGGYVSFQILEDLELGTIEIKFLPARECYGFYLKNKRVDIETFFHSTTTI